MNDLTNFAQAIDAMESKLERLKKKTSRQKNEIKKDLSNLRSFVASEDGTPEQRETVASGILSLEDQLKLTPEVSLDKIQKEVAAIYENQSDNSTYYFQRKREEKVAGQQVLLQEYKDLKARTNPANLTSHEARQELVKDINTLTPKIASTHPNLAQNIRDFAAGMTPEPVDSVKEFLKQAESEDLSEMTTEAAMGMVDSVYENQSQNSTYYFQRNEALSKMRSASTSKIAGLNPVGTTILDQMGGRRVPMMLGGRLYDVPNGVGIKWPNKQTTKGNYVEIKLNGMDLYDMTFYSISARGKQERKKFKGLYSDMLVSTFENHTGWYLKM